MKSRRYTDDELIQAVQQSFSIRQVLKKLKLAPYGGNYVTIKRAIHFLKLDTSHFTGRGWRRGKKFIPKRDLFEYLNNKFPIQSNKLKRRLLSEGIMKHICFCCGLSKWNGKKIPLEIHHINGDCKDNRLINICLLCPNCHAFTPTYRGKNSKSLARD